MSIVSNQGDDHGNSGCSRMNIWTVCFTSRRYVAVY